VQAHRLRGALRTLLNAPGAPTQRTLAARSGVAERTISRILHGNDQTTRFDIADALLTALDAANTLDESTRAPEVLDG
jgi:transcriptional regulator with XRE-family HTH domain